MQPKEKALQNYEKNPTLEQTNVRFYTYSI
nr:MAG TPA: hypothetical protein [Caudoviricetes sp.]